MLSLLISDTIDCQEATGDFFILKITLDHPWNRLAKNLLLRRLLY